MDETIDCSWHCIPLHGKERMLASEKKEEFYRQSNDEKR